MTAALALLPVILQALPTVEVGVSSLISWVENVRTSAQQSGEWTPELESAYQASLLASKTNPAYLPDAQA